VDLGGSGSHSSPHGDYQWEIRSQTSNQWAITPTLAALEARYARKFNKLPEKMRAAGEVENLFPHFANLIQKHFVGISS
jgi:hypothetical protein